MPQCSALNCKNRGRHLFPKDAKRRKQWEIALRIKNSKASKSAQLCSDHSKEDDYFGKSKYTDGVFQRISSIFSPNRKPFNPEHFRFALLGLIMCSVMNEILAYMLIWQSIKQGEIPPYFMDFVFVSISLVAAIALPILCWAGSKRRITVLTVWPLIGTIIVVPLFFMPIQITQYSELCNAVSVIQGLPALSVARLVIVSLLALVNSLAISALFSHGLALSYSQSPGTVSMDIAVILGFKVFVMTSGFEIMYEMIQNRQWLQLLILIPHPIVSVLMLRRSYQNEIQVDYVEKRESAFFSTLTGVITNKWAMIHVLATALLVTGLWGFTSNDYDATTAKYRVLWTYNTANGFFMAAKGFIIILFIKINGYDFSSPITMRFTKSSASNNSAKQISRAMIGLVIMAVVDCVKTDIVGVSISGYHVPSCSGGCSCGTPGTQFNPVCLLDTMTTYFSPCHAGCNATLDVNNVTLYSNCRCSGEGRAMPAACANADCVLKYQGHQLIQSIVIAFVLIAIMMQMLLVLRSVQAREKSVALGVTFSVTSLVAFVGGHLGYKGIALKTCLYWDGGKCQLQSDKFGMIIYFVSMGIFGIVLILDLIMRRVYKRQQKSEKSAVEMTIIE